MLGPSMQVSLLGDEHLASARAFLEAHADSTLLLLSSLMEQGVRLGDARSSGNFRCVHTGSEIHAVFCLNRRGNLLVETGGRTDLAAQIATACVSEPIAIRGVLGEWCAASSVWEQLRAAHACVEEFRSREWLYRLEIARATGGEAAPQGRFLRPEEFGAWEPVNTAFIAEVGMTIRATLAERREAFEHDARARRFFGCFDRGRLVSVAHLNALHASHGQIGGVYTAPGHRRRGLCRAVMRTLIVESARVHGLTHLVLFTGEDNHPAQGVYESLGFQRVGEFALFFGRAPG
jgi:ribosomal protein S18 acetylase RimI-like enzyme